MPVKAWRFCALLWTIQNIKPYDITVFLSDIYLIFGYILLKYFKISVRRRSQAVVFIIL